MNSLRPKVELFAQKFGVEKFNKFCFFALRSKVRDLRLPSLGKVYTVVIFCLNSSYEEGVLKKFSNEFIQKYEKAIVEENNFNKIQVYRLKQNIMIQYYDPLEKINVFSPRIPNYYTSFAHEGLVLNESPDYNPINVKYSFRFDQIINCRGDEASTLKKVLNPEISTLFKPDYCCVSYLVDWNNNGVKNMFCSMYEKSWKCKVDIKIFQSTLYNHCLTQNLEKINQQKKINKDLGKIQIPFLERANILSTLREVDRINPDNIWDKNSHFNKLLSNEKKTLKKDIFNSLDALNKEVSDGRKNLEGGCLEIIKKHKKLSSKYYIGYIFLEINNIFYN